MWKKQNKTCLSAWLCMYVYVCQMLTPYTTLNPRLELDKNVIISAMFTKCWTLPRPKVRLLNHDSLLTLNCWHHLKISEPHSEERRSSGQTDANRRGRRGLKTQKERVGNETSTAFRLRHHGALSGHALPAMPPRLPVCQGGRNSLWV